MNTENNWWYSQTGASISVFVLCLSVQGVLRITRVRNETYLRTFPNVKQPGSSQKSVAGWFHAARQWIKLIRAPSPV